MRDAFYWALTMIAAISAAAIVGIYLAGHLGAMLVGIAKWRGSTRSLPKWLETLGFGLHPPIEERRHASRRQHDRRTNQRRQQADDEVGRERRATERRQQDRRYRERRQYAVAC
ncbi:MAG: hypothetical protein AAF493_09865 [Pseudomonadota bacterium]